KNAPQYFDLFRSNIWVHINQVLTREQIIEAVWGYDYYGDTNVIDVYVRYLRKKLDIDTESIITSVRGIGYILKD
ncbi:DNA-binding response regulator, partial [Mammaliicoccus sciuri]|uniref:winged helix-turn-helix domain-containing protein n=1 Tax=Mammaliicoccus sciuri TaxID=1296 RepID=UPI000D4DBFAE